MASLVTFFLYLAHNHCRSVQTIQECTYADSFRKATLSVAIPAFLIAISFLIFLIYTKSPEHSEIFYVVALLNILAVVGFTMAMALIEPSAPLSLYQHLWIAELALVIPTSFACFLLMSQSSCSSACENIACGLETVECCLECCSCTAELVAAVVDDK